MNCDSEQLVAYLYNELEPSVQKGFEVHLSECSQCRKSLDELIGTRQTLSSWPDEDANMNLVFVNGPARPLLRLKESLRARQWKIPAIGLSAAIATVLLLALVDFQFHYQSGRVSLQLDLSPAVGVESSVPTKPVEREEFLATQHRSLELIYTMILQSEARQRHQFDSKLSQFADALELQRYRDLELVAARIEVRDSYTENRLRRSESVLEQLIPALQYR